MCPRGRCEQGHRGSPCRSTELEPSNTQQRQRLPFPWLQAATLIESSALLQPSAVFWGGGHSSPRANPQQAKTPAWPSRSSSLSSGNVAWAGRPSPALAAAARLGNKKPPLVQPPKLGQLCPERSQKKICGMRFANAGEFKRFSAGDPQGCAIPVQGFEGRWQRLPRVLPELETIEQRSFVHKNIIYKKNPPLALFLMNNAHPEPPLFPQMRVFFFFLLHASK